MYITSFLQDGQLTIALTGEIDHHCAKKFIQSITAKIEAYTPKVCILDFQDVTFMDSSGIAVVINAIRAMARIEGKLVMCGVAEQPMKVFRASGIDKLIQIKEAVG
jgi:stage II sporulation protein AA (anti-sigma F factor antagonist)